MAKITGVHHIALTPTRENFDRTIAFYTDVLGLEVKASWENTDKFALVSCGDNTVLEIMGKGETDNMGDGSFVHLALCCDEVDEMLEKVVKAGYEVTMEPKDIALGTTPPTPARIAFFRGPINEHIELFKVY